MVSIELYVLVGHTTVITVTAIRVPVDVDFFGVSSQCATCSALPHAGTHLRVFVIPLFLTAFRAMAKVRFLIGVMT